MPGIPAWAQAYLERALPGNPVLGAVALSRNRVLATTRQGAVLVRRGLLGTVTHTLAEAPQARVAFRCGGCGHNLQFYGLALPAAVYCSICAAKFHVDERGAATDAAGQAVAAAGQGRAGQCACCAEGCCEGGSCCDHAGCGACCERTGRRREGCEPARCCPGQACQCCAAQAGAAPTHAVEPAPGFTHNGYTLYRREVETKAGSRPLYFFSKGQPRSGQAAPLPEGHEVGVHDRTGLPFLRRGGQGAPGAASAAAMGYKGGSHPALAVEGIGESRAQRLKECGVTTTDELCRSDAQALAGRMGEAVATIQFWQQMAELMKVKGIGPQYAEALAGAGVAGIDALKAAPAAEIARSANAWLDGRRQAGVKARLTAAQVRGWQKAARAMRKVKQAPHPLA